MVIVGFVTATDYIQLVTAVFFFPLFIYFVNRIFPRRTHAIVIKPKKEVATAEVLDPQTVKLKKLGVDVDRRTFLKLIGSAGLSVFIFSMFTKRAQAAFFGSVPGPGVVAIKDSLGNKIDPAERQPTDGYKISELDDSTPAYYGFINKNGAWYIMKETATGSYLYVRGDTDFTGNWATHGTRNDYVTFDNAF